MSDVYRKIGFDVAGAIDGLSRLTNSLNHASGALSSFDRAAGAVRGGSFGDSLGAAKDQMVQFSDGSVGAVKSLDDLVAGAQRAKAGLKPLNPVLDENKKRLGSFADAINRTVKTIQTILITRAIIGVLGGLARAFREAGERAKEFQLSIAEIQTIGDSLSLSSAQLTDRILEISAALGSDANTTAQGLYQVLSNQVVEAGESFQFLEQAQKLAITTQATTAESVDALSSVMNAYQLDVAETARVSDTLFEAVNVGRFKLEDIADIIGRVLPITAEMGVRYQEVAAAIATMTQSGVRADTAITQLRAITTKLLKPTDALSALYAKWGVKDGPAAIAAFGGLGGVLDKLRQETGNSIPELAELFNEVRGLAGALGLGVDNGKRFAEVLDTIDQAAANNRAETAFQGFQASEVQQLVVATEQWNAELVKLGTALIPLRKALFGLGEAFALGLRTISDALFQSQTDRAIAATDTAIDEIQKKYTKARKEYTALDEEGYREQKQAALQYAAETTAIFNRMAGVFQTRITASTSGFKQYLDGIVESYKGAFDGLKKYVDEVNQKIKDSQDVVKDLRQKLADEEFRQELKRTEEGAATQKKILERGMREYWDARAKISKVGLDEEKKEEVKAQLESSEKLLREASTNGAFARFTQDADLGVNNAIKAQIELEEQFQRNLVQGKSKVNGALGSVGNKYQEVKGIVDKLKDSSDALDEAFLKDDPKEVDKIFKDMQALEARLKELGLTASEIDILKSIGFEGPDINNAIQKGLDGAQYNWLSAITSLKAQLAKETFKFNASPEVAKAVGALGLAPGELFGLADTLKVPYPKGITNEASLADPVLRAAEERNKKDFEALQNYIQSDSTMRDLIKELNDSVDRDIRSVDADTFAGSIDFSDKLQLALAKNIPIVGERIVSRIFKAMVDDPNTGPQLQAAADAATAPIRQVKEELNTVLEDGFISPEEKSTLDTMIKGSEQWKGNNEASLRAIESIRQQVELIYNSGQTKAQEGSLLNVDPAASEAALRVIEELGGGSENLEGMREQMQGIRQDASQLPTPLNVMKRLFGETQGAAEGTDQSTNDINTSLTEGLPTLTQTALLYRSMAQSADSTYKSLKAIDDMKEEGGGGDTQAAYAGKYFARGGLGSLVPMSRGVDTIPAMIKRGEFVVNDKSSRKFFSQLNAMNQGLQPVYRREGGSVTKVGDVNVTVHGGDTSRQTVRAIAAELNRELKRGTIRLGSLRKA